MELARNNWFSQSGFINLLEKGGIINIEHNKKIGWTYYWSYSLVALGALGVVAILNFLFGPQMFIPQTASFVLALAITFPINVAINIFRYIRNKKASTNEKT